MNKGTLFFSLSSVVAVAGVFLACSSTTNVTVADEAGPSDGGKPEAAKETSTPDTSTPADPDEACAAEAKLQACGQCCATNHAKGYKVLEDALLECGCNGTNVDGGAACAAECATTACKTPPAQPDTTCQTCLEGSIQAGGACQASASTACQAEPDCLAQQKCVQPCQNKP